MKKCCTEGNREKQNKKKKSQDEGKDGIKTWGGKKSENEVLHIKDDRGSYSSLPISIFLFP